MNLIKSWFSFERYYPKYTPELYKTFLSVWN